MRCCTPTWLNRRSVLCRCQQSCFWPALLYYGQTNGGPPMRSSDQKVSEREAQANDMHVGISSSLMLTEKPTDVEEPWPSLQLSGTLSEAHRCLVRCIDTSSLHFAGLQDSNVTRADPQQQRTNRAGPTPNQARRVSSR
jgi:hypothetical protein